MRALIFDMDGTLVDNMGYHQQAWFETFRRLGVEMGVEEFHRRTSGKTNPEIIRVVFGERFGSDEITRIADEKEVYYRDMAQRLLTPLPGLEVFLQAVKKGDYPTALATSAGVENVDFVLGKFGIETYFDVKVSAEDIQKSKPNPEIFLMAAERLGVSPGDCVVFEDSRAGLQAAANAGMQIVGVATSLHPDEIRQYPGVRRVIADYSGLDAGVF